ncbi:MAG: class I SAM-dependent methyltransferase [Methanogenium sp.]|jgi:SAM-dependent methyltransferase
MIYESLEKAHDYWKNPKENRNKPENYILFKERTNFLFKELFQLKEIDKNYTFFEIGCNSGRDLIFLYDNGFKNLTGIDINKKVIEFAQKQLINTNVRLINNEIEKEIILFNDNEFDVVFSFATLMQIHDDSFWIFDEILRIAQKYIIIVENEKRDYKTIFEKNNFKQIKELKFEHKNLLINNIDYLIGKVFKRK